MNRIIKLSIILVFLIGIAAAKAAPAPMGVQVSFSFFYDRLAPQGQWIELDDGLLVWKPNHVRFGWSPYAYGSWVWTKYGWYWDSNEPFGDVVYHYGRWYNDDYYGWIWVPDYDWAPAWVDWRYDDNYIGWAPLPPYARFSAGVGITFTTGYAVHVSHWNFVPFRRFCEPYVANFFINDRIKVRVFDRMAERRVYGYENNIVINRGIDREIIERRTRTTVRERDIVFRDAGDLNGRATRNTGNRIEIGIPGRDVKVREVKDMTFTRGGRSTTLDVNRVAVGERRGTLEHPESRAIGNGRDARQPEVGKTNPVNRAPVTNDRNVDTKRPANMERFPAVAPERKVLKQERKQEKVEQKAEERKTREQREARPEQERRPERDGASRFENRNNTPGRGMAQASQRSERNFGREERNR